MLFTAAYHLVRPLEKQLLVCGIGVGVAGKEASSYSDRQSEAAPMCRPSLQVLGNSGTYATLVCRSGWTSVVTCWKVHGHAFAKWYLARVGSR